MGRLFGTDGVRGIANRELTGELAYKLGQAGAYVLAEERHHTPTILIGLDTRISCDMIENAIVAGICSVGAQAMCIGVVPTPAVAYLTRKYKADAGVVISASHNSFEFNGIKFFNANGYKLSDAIEHRIESIILENSEQLPAPTGSDIGYKTYVETALDDYIEYAKSIINTNLKGLKIVMDCANGSSYKAAPKAIKALGAETIVIHNKPDGININKNCGSTHMEELREIVLKKGCDIGIAFDGDADRMLAIDEKGEFVDGDKIMSIIGLELAKEGKLEGNAIVVTVMSNLGLNEMAKKNGITLSKTKVGDRYVLENMLENGYVLGGEQSGHVIMLEHNTTGDGLISALSLLSVMKKSGMTLSQLASVMNIYPQVLRNARVENHKKNDYLSDEIINKKCKELEEHFMGEGRVLIRPSGTEPLVRVMIEGKELEYIERKAEELVAVIESRLS